MDGEGGCESSSLSPLRSAYTEPMTPSSNASLSPTGSPVSEVAFEKPSLPSAADWSEFLSASASEKVESELAQLTLSDHEQRELYEAARLVQTAFRKYKVKEGRPRPRLLLPAVCGLIKRLSGDVTLRYFYNDSPEL